MTVTRLCSIDGCARKGPYAGPLCPMHHRRRKRTGEIGPAGKLDMSGNGVGRCMASNGYVRVLRPGHPLAHNYGWVYEHRLVAFEAGLLTGPDDDRHVHHRNHDRTDNRLENLEVLTPADHGIEHRRIDRSAAVSLYLAGLSTIAVGDLLGADPATVSRLLAAAGVEARKGAPNKIDVDLAVVLPRLRNGESPVWIARDLGVPVATVRRVQREHGIKPRRAGRPTNLELAS